MVDSINSRGIIMVRRILNRIIALLLVTTISMGNLASANASTGITDNENLDIVGIEEENKITSSLYEEFLNVIGDEKLPVMVWFEDIDHTGIDEIGAESIGMSLKEFNEAIDEDALPLEVIQDYIEAKRQESTCRYAEHNSNYCEAYFDSEDIIYISKYSPIILVYLSLEEAENLSSEHSVMRMDLYRENDTVQISIANNVTRASNAYSTYGYTGSGVKIGVFELNLPNTSSSVFSSLNIVSTNGTVGTYSDHANSVLEIVASIAPNGQYYLSDNSAQSNFESIEWMLGKGVNVINCSRTVTGDGLNNYGSVSLWLDHLTYYHDVHFVISSGNNGEDGVISGGMAYNVITVGNINDNRTLSYSDDTLRSTSSYYKYNTWAKKPDLCAPGTGLTTSFSSSFTGTSASAPQVTGTVAIICQQKPALLVKQSVMKSLLAASVNFTSTLRYVPSNTNYKKYGAGLLDSLGASWVAAHARYLSSSISTSTSSKSHYFTVTSSDTRIRVALSIIKHSSFSSSSGHETGTPISVGLSDLDLKVYAPGSSTPIQTSATNNSVEIVDFVPTVTGTYRIEVINTSSAETTYYALAWR